MGILGADKKNRQQSDSNATTTATSNKEPHNVALQSLLTSSDCPSCVKKGKKGGIDAMKLVGIPYFGPVDMNLMSEGAHNLQSCPETQTDDGVLSVPIANLSQRLASEFSVNAVAVDRHRRNRCVGVLSPYVHYSALYICAP